MVENRAGAGGTVAYAQVAKSPPDGYTLIGVTSGYTITPAVYTKLAYDPLKDFAPISLVSQAPFLLVIHPSLPAKSVKDLLALAKAQPGKLDCGSAGQGSSTHMAFELFRIAAGVKITHIPYKGTGPALVDAMAGQVHMLFGNVLSTLDVCESRPIAGAGGDDGCALQGIAGLADDCGIRSARIRKQHLARLARPGRNAAGHPEPAPTRNSSRAPRRPTCWKSWQPTAARE